METGAVDSQLVQAIGQVVVSAGLLEGALGVLINALEGRGVEHVQAMTLETSCRIWGRLDYRVTDRRLRERSIALRDVVNPLRARRNDVVHGWWTYAGPSGGVVGRLKPSGTVLEVRDISRAELLALAAELDAVKVDVLDLADDVDAAMYDESPESGEPEPRL